MLSISIVNYLNALPFRYGLQQSSLINDIQVHHDHPSDCALKLINKTVDIGLVPVTTLLKLPKAYIITNYCIGAFGKVDSVALFSQVPLDKIEVVLLDYQSNTSNVLIQILNKHFWHLPIQFTMSKPGFENSINGTTAALVIGDRAFEISNYQYKYDLSEEWFKHTNLPFVFACWVSQTVIENYFINALNNAFSYGIQHINAALLDDSNSNLIIDKKDYLTNKISYQFDIKKQESLQYFLNLCKNH